MKGLVAVTDHEWFEFLAQQQGLDEVNFWRPSDQRTPRQLVEGTPLLFKLKKSYGGWIVGWGLFARHEVLPAWLAWDAFGLSNGAPDFESMRRRVERLRRDHALAGNSAGDYKIGCVMLAEPVFLPREAWVRPPAEWPENAVQGKAYDLAEGEGARVWHECLEGARAAGFDAQARRYAASEGEARRFGEPVLVRPRLGQGIFRLAVTDAYGRACTVTSEHSLPALEAAHIRPYGDGGSHEVPNGLLLRSDIHKLFDKGYVGVTPDYKFVVSDRLKGDYSNGKSYYPLHGKAITLPPTVADRPNPAYLSWHLTSCFRG